MIFEKIVKNLSLQKFQLFECFQYGTPCCSNAHNELVENLVKEDFFL